MTSEWMTRAEVAAWLRVTPQALAYWRAAGVGPKHIKLGPGRRAKTRYRRVDVEAWIEKQSKRKEAVA